MPVPSLLQLLHLLIEEPVAPLGPVATARPAPPFVTRFAALPALTHVPQLVSHVHGPLLYPSRTHDHTSGIAFGPLTRLASGQRPRIWRRRHIAARKVPLPTFHAIASARRVPRECRAQRSSHNVDIGSARLRRSRTRFTTPETRAGNAGAHGPQRPGGRRGDDHPRLRDRPRPLPPHSRRTRRHRRPGAAGAGAAPVEAAAITADALERLRPSGQPCSRISGRWTKPDDGTRCRPCLPSARSTADRRRH
jgi:hypothetical protein